MPKPEVHPDAFGALNSEFYGASPAEYLQMRLRALLTMLSSEVAGFASSGSGEYEGLRFTFGPDGAAVIDRYRALESTVLLHHAAEALLRLYLGHAHQNPCPWAAVASMRDFRKFKADVALLRDDLSSEDRQTDLLEVFTAKTDPATFKESADEIQSHREGLALALREAADTFLSDSNIYNAAKHGLALLASPSSLSFSATEDPSSTWGASGLALVTLEVAEHRWHQRTTWLHVRRSLALIHVWTELIQSLWESARMRYLGAGDPTKLRRLDAESLKAILADRSNTSGLVSLSMPLRHVGED
jgi:hypothetical protein